MKKYLSLILFFCIFVYVSVATAQPWRGGPIGDGRFIAVENAAYNAAWNADTDGASKNVIYDYLVNFDADSDGSFVDEAWYIAGAIPEVEDEAFTALNFNGDITAGVSQDDFYDRMNLLDTDDDGDIDTIDVVLWATKQNGDPDLTTYAGITPSADVQALLGAANEAAIRTLLDVEVGVDFNAYDTDLTTYAGITPSANMQTFLGAANYGGMRTQLNLVIGTDVQAWDTDLDTYAGITPSANIQTYMAAADYAAMRVLLGLVIGTNIQVWDTDLDTYAGITPSANMQAFLDDADFATMLTTLSLTIGTNTQAWDADLDTYAGVTPSAAAQTFIAGGELATDEDVDIDFDANTEEMNVASSAEYGADGAQVTIENTNASIDDGNMYLFRFRYTDSGNPNADFVIFEDNGGDDLLGISHTGSIIMGLGAAGEGGMLYPSHEELTVDNGGTACSVGQVVTYITTDGDANEDNCTLGAAGGVNAMKIFIVKVEGAGGDTVKITPANMNGGSKLSSDGTVGHSCILMFDGANWNVLGAPNGFVIS